MREVSYKTFCNFGALRNPRFFTRAMRTRDGRYLGTKYFDAEDGPLYYVASRPA